MMWAAALFVLASSPLRAQTGGTVEGRVINSATGAGLGGVAVTLWTQQGSNYHITTDETGAWHVTDMKPGQYDSRFEKSGFVEPPRATPWPASALRVGAAGIPIRVDTALTPLATLRGRVLDSDGKPLADVDVGFNRFQTTRTGSDGQFALSEVKPGSYTLEAKPPQPKEEPVQPGREQIVRTYYPSAVDRAQAGKILVHGGEDLSGFEIRLRTSPVYRLHGAVLDESGKAVAQATVHLTSRGNETVFAGQMMMGNPGGVRYYIGAPQQIEEASTQSGKDGAFEFQSVIPGEWYLRAETEPQRDSRQNLSLHWSTDVPVTVDDHDLGDIQIQFAPTFTLQATLDWGDRPPPAGNARGYGALFLISLDNSQLSMPRVSKEPGDTLSFENVAAGRYRIVPLPGLPAGYYPVSATLGGQDVLGQPVELSAVTPPLRIAYKPNAGMLHGTVEKGENATVLIWPQTTPTLDLVRATQAGPDGTFEIGSVAPGDYYVLAVDRSDLQTQSEASLRHLIPEAARASVGENATASLMLTLTHLASE